ncbi:MAG: hypothetical protein DRJ47_00950 [Thermoprotei archaeon]|nr:MAG: hypothetical protein DRJ47_00950 [Thermoprotei archaeon]
MSPSKGKELPQSVKIALIALFSALTAVLTYFTRVPSPTGGYTHIGDSAIYVAALIFGIQVGAPVGVIGPLVTDLVTGYPRWYVSLVAHGIQGVVASLAKGKNTLVQTCVIFLAGVLMAFTYFSVNVFIKGLAPAISSLARDIFGQTLVSVIVAIPVVKAIEKTGIVATEK